VQFGEELTLFDTFGRVLGYVGISICRLKQFRPVLAKVRKFAPKLEFQKFDFVYCAMAHVCG